MQLSDNYDRDIDHAGTSGYFQLDNSGMFHVTTITLFSLYLLILSYSTSDTPITLFVLFMCRYKPQHTTAHSPAGDQWH